MVTKEDKNKTSVEISFDALASMDLGKFENEWLLLVNGDIVEHSKSEKEILKLSKESYPDVVTCIVKVPKKEIFAIYAYIAWFLVTEISIV